MSKLVKGCLLLLAPIGVVLGILVKAYSLLSVIQGLAIVVWVLVGGVSLISGLALIIEHYEEKKPGPVDIESARREAKEIVKSIYKEGKP